MGQTRLQGTGTQVDKHTDTHDWLCLSEFEACVKDSMTDMQCVKQCRSSIFAEQRCAQHGFIQLTNDAREGVDYWQTSIVGDVLLLVLHTDSLLLSRSCMTQMHL